MDNEIALSICEQARENEKTDIDDSFVDEEEESCSSFVRKSFNNISFHKTDYEVSRVQPFTTRQKKAIELFNEEIKKATNILEKKLKKKLVVYQRSDHYGNIEITITKAPKPIQLVPERIENYGK